MAKVVKLGPNASLFFCVQTKFELKAGEVKPWPEKVSQLMEEWVRGGGLLLEDASEQGENLDRLEILNKLVEARKSGEDVLALALKLGVPEDEAQEAVHSVEAYILERNSKGRARK